jgi:hypothetical protein
MEGLDAFERDSEDIFLIRDFLKRLKYSEFSKTNRPDEFGISHSGN